MTIHHLAAAGAIVLNAPIMFAASALSVGALAVSVVLLAAIGAALGAITAWAISTQPETVAADTTTLAPARAERIAA
jgi:membrane protein YqaA with SNARE-associated domain